MISQRDLYEKSIVTRLYRDYEDKKVLSLIRDVKYIVDIGCGEGITLEKLAWKFPESTVVGVDLSPEHMEICKRLGLPVIRGDTYNLGFGDDSIDCCLFMEVIEHLDHPGKALREIHRVLRKDGLLLVLIPNDITFLIARILTLKLKEAFYDLGHLKRWNPKLLKKELRQHGFRVVSSSAVPLYFWPFSLHYLIAGKK